MANQILNEKLENNDKKQLALVLLVVSFNFKYGF
jgi:hypothetical protein